MRRREFVKGVLAACGRVDDVRHGRPDRIESGFRIQPRRTKSLRPQFQKCGVLPHFSPIRP